MNPFTQQGAFGPEATAAMGEAFDAACEELRCTSQPEAIRELIARLIISAASRGELDPIRLRMVAMARSPLKRHPPRIGDLDADHLYRRVAGVLDDVTLRHC
jgi:hypothetical protein